ncbi:MAG: hypothetical protein GY716_09990 [bacterium]|nr:hypothetical protein [bacterium]
MIRRPIALAVSSILLFLVFAPSVATQSRCDARRYRLGGRVEGGAGRPVADARVHLLLDRVSQKKFHKQGIRARKARTDRHGRYDLEVACADSAPELRNAPDPCAAKVQHVTVLAAAPAHRMKLQTFKLTELEVTADGCTIRVPTVTLRPD